MKNKKDLAHVATMGDSTDSRTAPTVVPTATEGPWEVGDCDRNGQRIVRGPHYEICTCWHHCLGSIEQEMEANARLIASAPDMLTVLRAILIDASAYQWHPTVRDVIAKAEGHE